MNDSYIGPELETDEQSEYDAAMAAAQHADDCARRLAVRECWLRIKRGTFNQVDIDEVDAALRSLL